MIIIREVTALVKYEKLKIHSHFTDMLTATISHDMRTPLNAIISVSKNLAYHLSQPKPNPEISDRYLQIVMNSATLLNFSINDLGDLFKIRAGKFQSFEVEADLEFIINDLFQIFSIQSREKGLSLRLNCEESVPRILNLDE